MSLNGFAFMIALLRDGHASAPPPRPSTLLSARLTISGTCKLLRVKRGDSLWSASEPVRVEKRVVQMLPGSRTLLVTLLF